MLTLLIFLIILGLLVLSHEFGHFVAARKSGMKVYEFGFGFPPRLGGVQVLKKISDKNDANPVKRYRLVWGRKRVEDLPDLDGYQAGTVYSFNWLPLGGFVRIKGEEGQEQGPDSFVAKSFSKKAIVLVSGVVMNVLLAAVIFCFGFIIGLPQALDGTDNSAIVKDRQLQIIQILPNMPAAAAGLKTGDVIVKIGEIDNPRLKQLQDYVDQKRDKELAVIVKRGEELVSKKIKPVVYQDTGRGGIGVGITEVGIIKYPWYLAISKGFIITGLYLKEIVVGFYLIIKGLIMGTGAGAAVSGPVGIAVMTGQIARMGLSYVLSFTAILSLNLAIINILPIPALDGGRLLFLIISKIFRRQLSMRFEQLAHMAGFVLLMLLVIVVTVKDVSRFRGVFSGLINKIF